VGRHRGGDGAWAEYARKVPPAPPCVAEEARDRPSRQAGHPLTWDLINAGTVLEGEAYPYPVFL
jgi:hypothetical protein